jgi:hypothetical protein
VLFLVGALELFLNHTIVVSLSAWLVAGSLIAVAGAVGTAHNTWRAQHEAEHLELLRRLGMHIRLYVAYLLAGGGVLLAFVGVAVQVGLPYSYPVTLGPAAAALVGCSFLGSAAYFLYGLIRPVWGNARAPLWGFLAYDLALIAPLMSRLGSVDAAHRPALVASVAVLVLSGALAVYYLLVTPATRVWAPRQGQDERDKRMVTPLEEGEAPARETVGVAAHNSGGPETRGDRLV